MNQPIGEYLGVTLTAWKFIGLLGAIMFSARWLVQLLATRAARKPTIPRSFWYLSVAGSAMTLLYFVFGKNDAVGIVQNAPAFFIAAYNLFHELRQPSELVGTTLT